MPSPLRAHRPLARAGGGVPGLGLWSAPATAQPCMKDWRARAVGRGFRAFSLAPRRELDPGLTARRTRWSGRSGWSVSPWSPLLGRLEGLATRPLRPSSLLLDGRIWHGLQQSRRMVTSSTPSTTSPPPTPTSPPPPVTPRRPERKEDIYTLPNALTLVRICLSPVIGGLILQEAFPLALGLLVLSAGTDALDGWIARRYQSATVLGSVLDPAADKILMTSLVLSLSGVGLLPWGLGALVIGRDVLLVGGAAWYRWSSLPAPKTLQRYFDLALPSAEVRPPFISKLNTLLQLVLMGACVAAPVFQFTCSPLLVGLQWAVGITTVWSGLHYLLYQGQIIRILR